MRKTLSSFFLMSTLGLVSGCGYDKVYNPFVKVKKEKEEIQQYDFNYLFNNNFHNWNHFPRFAYDRCGDISCLEYSFNESNSTDEFHLLLSIIAQETRFGAESNIDSYPVSISSAKALNYTQLMPCTAIDRGLSVDPRSYYYNMGMCVNNLDYIPNPKIDERTNNQKMIKATFEHLRWIDENLRKKHYLRNPEKAILLAYYRGIGYSLKKMEQCPITFSCFLEDDLNYANTILENYSKLGNKMFL